MPYSLPRVAPYEAWIAADPFNGGGCVLTAGSAWIRAHSDVIDDAPAAIAETAESEVLSVSHRPEPGTRARGHLDMLGLWPKTSSHPPSGAVDARPAELVLFVALFFLLRRRHRLRKGQGQRVAVVRARLAALLHVRLAFEYQ